MQNIVASDNTLDILQNFELTNKHTGNNIACHVHITELCSLLQLVYL